MKEFGSDFHRCEQKFHSSLDYIRRIGDVRFYANGRLAIEAIIKQEGWKRIWMPSYFCYEVLEHLQSCNIKIMLYEDYPTNKNDEAVFQIPYMDGDVLFRINYFGLRDWKTNSNIKVPVIEDHTHDIISEWASNSDADWCIASLRKSLPIASGGILWSPKKLKLPPHTIASNECEKMAQIRYEAMNLKSDYLSGGYCKKEDFRNSFILSEELLDSLKVSGIDPISHNIISSFDVKEWVRLRHKNWELAVKLLNKKFNILKPEHHQCDPFSLILYCQSFEERESLRTHLIKNMVYPAILWSIPESSLSISSLDFSKRMLSIHCDARYNDEDIRCLCQIINSYYD